MLNIRVAPSSPQLLFREYSVAVHGSSEQAHRHAWLTTRTTRRSVEVGRTERRQCVATDAVVRDHTEVAMHGNGCGSGWQHGTWKREGRWWR